MAAKCIVQRETVEIRTRVDVIITSSGRRASSVLFVAPRKGHRRESMCKDVSRVSPRIRPRISDYESGMELNCSCT